MRRWVGAGSLALLVGLASGCALTAPPRSVSAEPPAQWFAPLPATGTAAGAALPHDGRAAALSDWWAAQGDPLLSELMAAAQAVSPTVAAARSRIEQARAAQVASGAGLRPTLDAQAAISRSRSQPTGPGGAPVISLAQLGLQTAWEIDVFGRNRAGLDAASSRQLAKL